MKNSPRRDLIQIDITTIFASLSKKSYSRWLSFLIKLYGFDYVVKTSTTLSNSLYISSGSSIFGI